MIRKVTEDFDTRWHFNTSIAAMMELVNELYAEERGSRRRPWNRPSVFSCSCWLRSRLIWPRSYGTSGSRRSGISAALAGFRPGTGRETDVEVPVQINGKIRARITVPTGLDKGALEAMARADEKVIAALEGKSIVKVIAVPDKLVNMVVK